MKRYSILKIESFEGEDSFVRCGTANQDFLFAIVVVDEPGAVEIIDSGYASYDEALKAWPEAEQRTEQSET